MDVGLVDCQTNEERELRSSDQVVEDVRREVSGSGWTEQQILEEHQRGRAERLVVTLPDPSTIKGSMENNLRSG